MSIKAIREEFTETHLAEDQKIMFVDADPEMAGEENKDVTHVLYLVNADQTLGVWFRYDKEDEITWMMRVANVSPNRPMAEAHYDAFKWRLFRKHDTSHRKLDETPFDREGLRKAVRYFYDLQKLRIQSGNRDSDQDKPAVLEDEDKDFFGRQSLGLEALEKSTLSEIGWLLNKVPIYTEWLKEQKGCGPTLSGVIVAEVDITRCETPSALWAYAGMAVDTQTGQAKRRKKGEKSNWNPFLKAKMLFVLGSCLLKANSPWRKHYDNYKHRKENQMVDTCMLCEGKGALVEKDSKQSPCAIGEKGAKKCYNCKGKCKNVPWGRGDAHRHQAATRYMVKMFMLELWTKWRELEGLTVTTPYAEAKLGMKHGDHASTTKEPEGQKRAARSKQPNGAQRATKGKQPDTEKRAAIRQHP